MRTLSVPEHTLLKRHTHFVATVNVYLDTEK